MLDGIELNCEDVLKNLNEIISKSLSGAMKESLTEAALILEKEARKQLRDNCPEEWQEYDEAEQVRKSITHKVSDSEAVVGSNTLMSVWLHQGTGLYAVNGDGRKDVPWYWKDDETGEWKSSSGRVPFPFLQKATESKKDDMLKAFQGSLEEQ